MHTFMFENEQPFPDGVVAGPGAFGPEQQDYREEIADRWSYYENRSLEIERALSSEGRGVAATAVIANGCYQNAQLKPSPEWARTALGLPEADVRIARSAQAALMHVWNSFEKGCDLLEPVREALAVYSHALSDSDERDKTTQTGHSDYQYRGFTEERLLPMQLIQNGRPLQADISAAVNEFWPKKLSELLDDRGTPGRVQFVRDTTNIIQDTGLKVSSEQTAQLLGVETVDDATAEAVQASLIALFAERGRFDCHLAIAAIQAFLRNHSGLRDLMDLGPPPRGRRQYMITTVPAP